MHGIGPSSLKNAGKRQVHQEVAKLSRVENVRVKKGDETGHS
jgi:hypothetical protein